MHLGVEIVLSWALNGNCASEDLCDGIIDDCGCSQTRIKDGALVSMRGLFWA